VWPRERAHNKCLDFCQIRMDAIALENNTAHGDCDGVSNYRTGKRMYDQWAESSRVQSSPVRLTKMRQAYTPAESSRVTRVLPSQESWCCMFYFRQSDSSNRAWRLLSWGINGCRKHILLLKNHEAIYDASRCEHRNRVLHWWWCS